MPPRSKAGGLCPPLPLPGASACEHSRPSVRWGPAAAGHPCCLSELWSAEQTSPNLETQTQGQPHTKRTQASASSDTTGHCPVSSGVPISASCMPASKTCRSEMCPEVWRFGQQLAFPTCVSCILTIALRPSRAGFRNKEIKAQRTHIQRKYLELRLLLCLRLCHWLTPGDGDGSLPWVTCLRLVSTPPSSDLAEPEPQTGVCA